MKRIIKKHLGADWQETDIVFASFWVYCVVFWLRKIHPELASAASLPLFFFFSCMWATTMAWPLTDKQCRSAPQTELRLPKQSVLNLITRPLRLALKLSF